MRFSILSLISAFEPSLSVHEHVYTHMHKHYFSHIASFYSKSVRLIVEVAKFSFIEFQR